MIASSFLVVVAVVGVALPPAEACTYWCMNPQSRTYICCDDGNPFYTGVAEGAPATSNEAVIVDPASADAVGDAGSFGCRYYCNYNSQVYCCDHGDGPLPTDHEDNAGRCPTQEEQSCKVSSNDKKPVGKISSVFVDKHDTMCASDGYCAEEEKCCPNKCNKKHTCMPSF